MHGHRPLVSGSMSKSTGKRVVFPKVLVAHKGVGKLMPPITSSTVAIPMRMMTWRGREGMPEKNEPSFEGLKPSTLFREFAAECMELAQTSPSPKKRALYLKMASVWHQMAQRWEKKD